MHLLAVFSALFYAGFVYRLATDQDVLNMAFQVVVGTLLGALFLYFRRERARDRSLLRRLQESAAGGDHGGPAIPRETELRVFEATVSIILFTIKIPSRHCVVGRDSLLAPRLVCSLTSLLLGWWGIPWGPLWTLQTLGRNLAGGRTLTVGDLLPEPAADRVVPVKVLD
jgi:hypothetical protein